MDEAFGFSVGARGVGPGKALPDVLAVEQHLEVSVAVAGAVVGEHAADAEAEAAEVSPTPVEEALGGSAGLVRQPTGLVTQLRAGATKIMRRELFERSQFCICNDKSPYCFLIRNALPDDCRFFDRAEDPTFCNRGRFLPRIDTYFDHRRDRNGPDVAALTCQIRNDPPAFALLQLVDGQRNDLAAPQTAGNEQCQDSSIALAFTSGRRGRLQELVDLGLEKPVPCSDTASLDPFCPLDRRSDGRVESKASMASSWGCCSLENCVRDDAR